MKAMMRSKGTTGLLVAIIGLLLLATPLTAAADNTEAEGSETSYSLGVGGRYADTDGDRTFIAPYDPMDSGVIVFFDLLNFKPGGRSFEFGGHFSDDQDYSVGARYNHGANFKIDVRAQEFFHAEDHQVFAPDFEVPADPFDTVHLVGSDVNPGADYYTDSREITADFKIRAPSYPAHVSGDVRVYRQEGPNQMRYFFRTCSTHICHANSKTRDIDTETQEFNIGFDTHAGPVDIVYNRNFLNFEDKADDPVDFYGDFFLGRFRAGDFEHHVNPETKSYYDEFRVNTNLTNRAVLALRYIGGKSENEDNDIREQDQRFVASGSYTASAKHFFSARYTYNRSRVDSISEELAALRERIGDAAEPGTEENGGEITYRLTFGPGSHAHAHVRYTDITREDTVLSGLPDSSSVTTADIDGHFRVSGNLSLEAELARDWTDNPAYPTDFTDRWRYRLGANWAPSPALGLIASYTGFLGTNDDEESLQVAYYDPPALAENFKREVDGHNILAAATWMCTDGVTLTLSYNYSLNDISADQIIGSADDEGFNFRSDNTPFESRYHIGGARADWAVSEMLRLALGGTVIAGDEKWEPAVAGRPDITAGLSETARAEFTKYMIDGEVGLDLTGGMGLTLAAFYADYNDKVENINDGSGGGVGATITKRW